MPQTSPSSAPGRPTRRLRVNWPAFLGTGAFLGFVLGVVVHLLGPDAAGYGMRTSALFLGAFGAMLGALLGGLAGVVADSVLGRR